MPLLISRLEALGRKPTTLSTYRSLLRTHLALLGDKPLDRLQLEDVEGADRRDASRRDRSEDDA